MQRGYEDPQQHLSRHMQRAAERYVDGLQKTGLAPNKRLMNALAERTLREAKQEYVDEATEQFESNIASILKEHDQRLNTIRREGASLRLKTCPLVTLVFAGMAWYSFAYTGDVLAGICYSLGALSFLAMLVLGAIFDRPR